MNVPRQDSKVKIKVEETFNCVEFWGVNSVKKKKEHYYLQ